MRRLLCAMALVVSWYVPAAAIGPDDPASVYYEKGVASARKAHVPDERCDGLITDGLMGIIIGQFDQEHPAFCLPQRLEHQMQAKSFSAVANLEAEMRAAVAGYMREHPKRRSRKDATGNICCTLACFSLPGLEVVLLHPPVSTQT